MQTGTTDCSIQALPGSLSEMSSQREGVSAGLPVFFQWFPLNMSILGSFPLHIGQFVNHIPPQGVSCNTIKYLYYEQFKVFIYKCIQYKYLDTYCTTHCYYNESVKSLRLKCINRFFMVISLVITVRL